MGKSERRFWERIHFLIEIRNARFGWPHGLKHKNLIFRSKTPCLIHFGVWGNPNSSTETMILEKGWLSFRIGTASVKGDPYFFWSEKMFLNGKAWKPHIHSGSLWTWDISIFGRLLGIASPLRFSSTWQWKRVNWMKLDQGFRSTELPWTTYKSETIHGYEFDPWMDMNQHFQPVDFPHDFPPLFTFHQSRSQEFTTKLDGKVDNVAWKEVSRACHHCHRIWKSSPFSSPFLATQKTDQPEDW